MAVDTNHKVFSSEAKLGGIAIQDMHSVEGALELEMFIAMDPPKHDQQRKAVTPAVAPSNLLLLEPTIRERACQILDDLPIGEEFDWVDKVSVELTTMTLATLFGGALIISGIVVENRQSGSAGAQEPLPPTQLRG